MNASGAGRGDTDQIGTVWAGTDRNGTEWTGPERADRLFVNGVIHTASALPEASVLAVRGDRIVYAGRDRKAGAAALAPGFAEVDLGGKTVVPGLMDSHLHLRVQGQRLTEMDIHLKPKEVILRMVAEEAGRLGPGRWIVGRGWNNEIWPDTRWPSKDELDDAAPANPVALTRADSHSIWVNTPALAASGFDRNSPEPRGGEILRKPDGDLLGILVETPMLKVWSVIPPLNEAELTKAYCLAQEELFGFGITSVGDAWQTADDHATLRAAYEAGLMKLRVYGMLASVRHDETPIFHEDMRPVSGLYGNRLSLRAFKAVLDGSLGSRSAWLSRDYADRPGHRGNSRYRDDVLRTLLAPPTRNGFQLCLHAIGDAAVAQALDAIEGLQRSATGQTEIQPGPPASSGPAGSLNTSGPCHPMNGPHCRTDGPRHRIEHFQTAGSADLARAARLGVIPAMQTIHEQADKAMAEHRLDPKLLERSYPWRAVLDAGGIIANGSDSPMEDGNPFHGFHAAVTRTPFSPFAGLPARSVRMTRQEALLSYTAWAAYAEFGEAEKGSLEAGKLADFAVLDTDIMTCPEEDIPRTRALMTVLGGEVVYRSGLF